MQLSARLVAGPTNHEAKPDGSQDGKASGEERQRAAVCSVTQ